VRLTLLRLLAGTLRVDRSLLARLSEVKPPQGSTSSARVSPKTPTSSRDFAGAGAPPHSTGKLSVTMQPTPD
jgi:hypothetical protein